MSQIDRNLVPPPSSQTVRLLRELKDAGERIRLSIHGKATLVIADEISYKILEGLVDRSDLIESVRTGLREIDEGKGVSLEDFKDEVRRTDGVPL